MSGRCWLSSRAALRALGGGALLLAGGCAFIYDFEGGYQPEAAATGSSTASGTGGGMASSSSATSGNGGAGGAPCAPAYKCGIVPLSEEPTKFYGDISLSVSRVFWARNNGFSYRDKDPTKPAREDRLNLGIVHVAAEDDNVLYFTTAKDVTQWNVSANATMDVMMNTNPTGLTMHMGFAYWPSSADGTIHKGKPGDTMSVNDLTGSSPALIASSGDGNPVFWAFRGDGMANGGIRKVAGGDVLLGQDGPSGVAADGEDVYWITREGKVHRYSNQVHAEVGPVLEGLSISEGRIAVGPSHIYWLGPDLATCKDPCQCNDFCGAVLRVSKNNFEDPPEVFADLDWQVLRGLAVDATDVYWTTGDEESKLLRKAH
jgi:hypothetical protein